MFVIKAVNKNGTTDMFEAGFISIPKSRKAVYLESPHDRTPQEILVGEEGYERVYVENNIGRTIEALYSNKDK